MAVVNDSYLSPRRYKVGGLVAGCDGRKYVIDTIHTKAQQVVLLGPVGETYVYESDEFRNRVAAGEQALEQLRILEVRAIIVDEVQHIAENLSTAKMKIAVHFLQYIVDQSKASMILVGLPSPGHCQKGGRPQ